MVKAIIMAGGEGTRLRPLTCNRPKPMIPVINKPVIEHAVNLLKRHNITDIIISLYYLPENIQNYFGDGSEWDVNITYSVEETPLGTAGGVKQAIGKHNDTFIVLSGDGIIDFDITEILNYHKSKQSEFTIMLTRVSKPTEYGIVITDENGRIQKFLEKPSWSEVFTDTANTGMYMIEPDIINEYVPANTKFDFSLNLFPILMENKVPLYGYVAKGYWCDVGNLNTYSQVHKDILDGLVSIEIPGKQISKNIWVGRDVDIHPEADIKAPVILGNFVRVKKGAEISEFSVIGDNCIIEDNASIRRSVILHSTVIGPKCELRGANIGKRCVLQEGVTLYEGSVVSDDCRLGKDVIIPSGIRVWPDKFIEQETRLTTDLIWGQTEKKTLFSSDGILGRFNLKINPEFASKLGSALGAYLGKNSKIVIGRDSTSAARIIKRAFTAGLLSMGTDVFDMEIESVPIIRYSIKFFKADMGVYIQISPFTGLQFLQIRIFDKHGFQISLSEEKKIENIFFRGDYPRKDAFETGKLVYPTHHIESYITNIGNYINLDILKERRWNLLVDCLHGTTSYVFPELLNYFGCNATVHRGQAREFISEEDIKNEIRISLKKMVKMAKINNEIGVLVNPHGTEITIVDETGNTLTNNDISAILSIYYLKYKNAKIIKIPVTISKKIENMITSHGGEVIRTSSKLYSPDKISDIFRTDTEERYPYLEQIYDPMITFLRVLKFLTIEDKPLYEIKESLPASNVTNTLIHCTIEEKAAVMRMLNIDADPEKTELIDGIKIYEDNAWVLILPDATQPIVHIYAEGETNKQRDEIIDKYTIKVRKFKNEISQRQI